MLFKHLDINIFYRKYGNKKNTILILPGWGNTSPTFTNIIDNLKDYFTIYIIDYPNFGNSPTPTKSLTIYDYAEIIKEFIKEKNIEPIIIAHSFGGRITSILEGKYKVKIKKNILIDVAGIKRKSIKQYIRTIIYKILMKISSKKQKEKIRNKFSSNDYKELNNTMKQTFKNIIKKDLTKYYKKINIDTLIIWGEKDNDTPLKDAKKLNRIIKNSGLIIFKKTNHYSYLEKPYETNLIIKEFIKKDMD